VSNDLPGRARNVRMVLMDVDGVLTDGRIYFGPWSSPAVAFSSVDGAGVKYLRRVGLKAGIITGRESPGTADRAAMLRMDEVIQGAKIKLDPYLEILQRQGLDDSQVAFIGDDLPDIPIMRRVGLAIAVPNAAPEVLEVAHLVTGKEGGRGAVREAVEFILKAQGKWEQILARYFDNDRTRTEKPREQGTDG